MPRVEALYQKVKEQGVDVIGLNVMDEEGNFKDWVKESRHPFHYKFARDNDGKNHEASGVADKLGVYAIPTIFLIDKDQTRSSWFSRGLMTKTKPSSRKH